MTPPPPPRRSLWSLYRGRDLPKTVRSLGLTSFFQDVASEMVYPLLPAFLIALGGGPFLLGVMEALAEGISTFLKAAAGRWSDRSGKRKPWVSAGYGLSALTRPFLALAALPWHVVALRAVDRVAKGLRSAPRDAWIAEVTEPERRGYAFAFHRGLDHLGAAVGPLLAALVLLAAPGENRWVFALATIPALIGWATVVWGTKEPGVAPRTREPETTAVPTPTVVSEAATEPVPVEGAPSDDSAATSWVPKPLRRPLAAFLLFALGNATDAFLLLAATAAGYSPIGLTVLWSAFHVAKTLASAPGGALSDRWGPKKSILLGWGIYVLVYLGFASPLGATPWGIAALFALYAVYYGLTEGAERAFVVRVARGMGAGSSLGAFHGVLGVGAISASLLFGALWQTVSPAAAFVTGAILAGVATLTFLTIGTPAEEAPVQ